MSSPNRALSYLEVRPSFLVALAMLSFCYCIQLGYLQGLLATASITLSLLLHELGHVVVASAYGANVKRIGFTVTGGYTVREFSGRRWVEAQSAAAGPLVNLVLFLLLDHAGTMAHAVARANLVLAVGNLVPLPHCDGGRLWKAIFSPTTMLEADVPSRATVPGKTQVIEAAGIRGKSFPIAISLPASNLLPQRVLFLAGATAQHVDDQQDRGHSPEH